jgi:AcrR family transcriptional regulator
MTDPNDRSTRVLDPAYLDDVESHSVEQLRAMHSECLELETEVSYIRRLAQARIDILEAEIGRRSSGQSLEQLIEALPQILADSGPRGNPALSRLPMQMAPEQDSEWAPDLQQFDGVFANLTTLTETELHDAIRGLRSLEREVSDQRRELHGVMDRIDQSLAAQLS